MGPVFGLYSHIRANRFRSGLLLVVLVLLVDVMVFAGALFGESVAHNYDLRSLLQLALRDTIRATPYVAIGVAVWVVIAYWSHQSIVEAMTGARRVSRTVEPRLYNLLENLCISRGMAVPQLEILDDPALNAFATGMSEGQYAITVTTALRDTLTDAEMEAVLAHELTHIRNEDVRMMVVAIIIAGVVGFFAEFFFRVLTRLRWSGGESSGDSDGRGTGGSFAGIIIAFVMVGLAWFLSLSIRFALSRSREYMADAGAVELTKNPDAMISALVKISGKGEIAAAPSGIMEMCVDNPRSGFFDLFATHPAIDDRIDALVRYAGGHRPDPEAPPQLPEPPAPSLVPAPGTAAQPWGAPTGSGDRVAAPWGRPL